MKNKAYIHTLGCRLNNADSALLNFRLRSKGFELAAKPDNDTALIIVNSCCVTAEAARKSMQFIRKMRKDFPQSKIIFTGCAAKNIDVEIDADYIVDDFKKWTI